MMTSDIYAKMCITNTIPLIHEEMKERFTKIFKSTIFSEVPSIMITVYRFEKASKSRNEEFYCHVLLQSKISKEFQVQSGVR